LFIQIHRYFETPLNCFFMKDALITTDQDLCYSEKGSIIPCSGTGQDGAFRVCRSWPKPRFSVQEDLVFDRLTRLTWAKDANLAGFPLTWCESLAYVDNMNQQKAFGRSDWKLPNRKQLFSLVSHMEANPALPKGHPFINVFSGYYWTSTEVARYPLQAWYVHFGGGRVFKGMKQGSYMVWPVREGLSDEGQERTSREEFLLSKVRFLDHGQSVTDRYTGLEWTKDARPVSQSLGWTSALRAVNVMNGEQAYGFSDWRLPNVRELESLTYMGSHSPALPPGHPFEAVQEYYWTSTTSTFEPTYAWVLYMVDGAVGVGFKGNSDFFVWPVRNSKVDE
jgi:hypothetical protein